MLARVPWSPNLKAVDKPKPRQLNKDRNRHLVETVAAILKSGEPTLFAFEASCRHGIRSSLCLQSWDWQEADIVAAEIVATALNRIGAMRPTWRQGQPEHTQDGFAAIQRRSCLHCGGIIPDERLEHSTRAVLYCDPLCGNAHRLARQRAAGERVSRAEHEAAMAARREKRTVEKQRDCPTCGTRFIARFWSSEYCSRECSPSVQRVLADRSCDNCGVGFRPRNASIRFCSRRCGYDHKSKAAGLGPRQCECCGTYYRARKQDSQFCSLSCTSKWRWQTLKSEAAG